MIAGSQGVLCQDGFGRGSNLHVSITFLTSTNGELVRSLGSFTILGDGLFKSD